MENKTKPPFNLSIDISKKINISCQQNSFHVLRSLQVENETDRSFSDLTLTLSSNPSFLKNKTWSIDTIREKSWLNISDRDIRLDANFLTKLNESMKGDLSLILKDADGISLAKKSLEIELLANNEWGGVEYMPELLASFVMPNDAVVDYILRDASDILQKAGKDDAIDGYSSKSRERVWEMISALYTAISHKQIKYSIPPASFERNGQKIRYPSRIIDSGLATCLDTALLFCAAFEQASLNPIIILTEGHALVGVWLQPETLSAVIDDQPEVLRKRHALNELIVFETTYVTQHPAPPLSKAIKTALETLSPENDAIFNCTIDIRKARAHQIKPLALDKAVTSKAGIRDQQQSFKIAFEEAPSLPNFDIQDDSNEFQDTPAGRIERWQRKLLDLSARNPLLNHKRNNQCLQFICPNPAELEDRLAEGQKISIQPLPQEILKRQDETLHRQKTGDSLVTGYVEHALKKKQLIANESATQLNKKCVSIYRAARSDFSEGGANTLFLTLGTLLWRRNEKDLTPFRAPLILVPVLMHRDSIVSPMQISAHDDETCFNPTLLEMLRNDFHIHIPYLEKELPKDAHGIDIQKTWQIVKQHIKNVPGFEVIEDVSLGLFSFSKFLLWKDLKDRIELLKESPVVKHLIDTPYEPFPAKVSFVKPNQLDHDYHPTDLLVPMPADASQMAAIASADKGKSFVIIGPPGTGKSQTIANMIAHLMATGKKVLFVSEKTAALEVVYQRLEKIGLGPFCLQLHSYKAKKMDVINQLNDSWATQTHQVETSWRDEAQKIFEIRDKLNQLSKSLHKVYPNGLTPFEAIGIIVRDQHLASLVGFKWPTPRQHDKPQFKKMKEAIEKLAVHLSGHQRIAEKPLDFIRQTRWSVQWVESLIQAANMTLAKSDPLNAALEKVLNLFGLEGIPSRIDFIDGLLQTFQDLPTYANYQCHFIFEEASGQMLRDLEDAIPLIQGIQKDIAQLSCEYEDLAWTKINGTALASDWSQAQNLFLPIKLFNQRKIKRQFKEAGALGEANPSSDGPVLDKIKKQYTKLKQLSQSLKKLRIWEDHHTSLEHLRTTLNQAKHLRALVFNLADTYSFSPNHLTQHLVNFLSTEAYQIEPNGLVSRAIKELRQCLLDFKNTVTLLGNYSKQPLSKSLTKENYQIASICEKASLILNHKENLRDWCTWQFRRQETINCGLSAFLKELEEGNIEPTLVEETFMACYCAWFSSAAISEDPVLSTFSSNEHTALLEKFRQKDDLYQKLTAEYIVARMSRTIPAPDDRNLSAEWGVLRHEIQKKARHMSIRLLNSSIPEVIRTLAPCQMMSPLSVAQYLPPDHKIFDVVIFDEASQITVWDAVGSLARGTQVIIAGDPKQMPPSNFFGRSNPADEDEIDQEGDLESILDEVIAAGLPTHTLNMHYRSKRESLIAFSNWHYYNNALTTFPAPFRLDRSVKFAQVDGFYSKGKDRTNAAEAEAIVSEIVYRLKHDDENIRTKSIGVVTFNAAQQIFIGNLLDEARKENPDIEWAFSDDHHQESVFVKNLESVQGDERDIILFSITYGPDINGHLSHNFGPLNRKGGERRLNVAITRARYEMKIFSTLSPDLINLSRTSARAVADLKYFLDFAYHGPEKLGSEARGSLGDPDSPFETAVARALEAQGWRIVHQVGISAYRIDLGIVHPDKPGRYFAGVECDGAMYHSSAFARERDKIRQQILESLGWTIFRIWSTDWWTNAAQALSNLVQQLEGRLERERAAEKAKATPAEQVNGAPQAPSNLSETGNPLIEPPSSNAELYTSAAPFEAEKTTTNLADSDAEDLEAGKLNGAGPPETDSLPMDPPSNMASIQENPELLDTNLLELAHLSGENQSLPDAPPNTPYETLIGNGDGFHDKPIATLSQPTPHFDQDNIDPYTYNFLEAEMLTVTVSPEQFYDSSYRSTLNQIINQVILIEGPIHQDVLIKRIARLHDFKRVGHQINGLLLELLERFQDYTVDKGSKFYWPAEAFNNREKTPIRFKNRDPEMRKLDFICIQELQGIASFLQIEDPVQLGKELGITRVTYQTRDRLQQALNKTTLHAQQRRSFSIRQ